MFYSNLITSATSVTMFLICGDKWLSKYHKKQDYNMITGIESGAIKTICSPNTFTVKYTHATDTIVLRSHY